MAYILTISPLGARLYNGERSLLHVAALGGSTELIEYLVKEQKMDVSALDSEGESPLFKAVHKGCALCVRILLVNGAYPNQVNVKNQNLLNIAIENGLVDIVRMLVEFNVDRSFLKLNGMSSLMLACATDQVEILALLAEDITPESIRHKDNDGNNIFHIIAINDSIQCANYLFKQINATFESFKDILYTHKNNEGLLLYDIVFQRKSEHLKEYLTFGHVEYFLHHPRHLHYLYDEGLYDMLVLILDKMVKIGPKVTVYLKFFDSTSDGLYPGDRGFRYFRKSLFHKMLDCPNEELKYHPVVGLLSEAKISPYRFVSYLQMFGHFIFLLIFSFALISASYTCEDQLFVYNDPISIARLICEIITVLFFIVFGFKLVLHFGTEWRLVSWIYLQIQSKPFFLTPVFSYYLRILIM